MPDLSGALSPNRSVELELEDERRLVRDGYQLLDEKRVLLANEILRRLAQYRAAAAEWLRIYRAARQPLAAAIAALGLDGVQIYPVTPRACKLTSTRQRLAGVSIQRLDATDFAAAGGVATNPVWPAAAASECGAEFLRLAELGAQLANEARNLRRLAREYRRTDRRARALDYVLLPEIESALRAVQEQLEYLETEETVRVHEAHRRITTTDSELTTRV